LLAFFKQTGRRAAYYIRKYESPDKHYIERKKLATTTAAATATTKA